MTRRMEGVLFDVIETLFPLDPVRRKLINSGLPEGALETWFARFRARGDAIPADVYQRIGFPDRRSVPRPRRGPPSRPARANGIPRSPPREHG